MSWKRLPLAWKLFAALASVTALTIAFLGIMIALSMRDGFTRYLVQAELNRFDDLALALALAHDPKAPSWPELKDHPAAWQAFARKAHRPVGPPPPPPFHLPGPPPGSDPLQLDERLVLLGQDGGHVAGSRERGPIFVRRPVLAAGAAPDASPIGWIGLLAPMGGPAGTDGFFLFGQYRSLLMTSLLALVLSSLAALLLARQILAPIKALSDEVASLTAGDFTARIAMQRQDELGVLIHHHNTLAQSLQDAENAERQWITDTSHELQTPLAVLRAEIEALQDGIRMPSDTTFADLHMSVMRLSRLVGDLNTLSRTREGALSTTLQADDLGDIIEEALADVRPRLAQADIALIAEIGDTLPISCDRLRVRQLIDNLLENSRRYTAAPGKIVLLANRTENAIIMTVEDTPPQPPAAAMEHLFKRFYRVEPSRSREHGGSGLGLAICQAIVKAHSGSIAASPSALGGLLITVTFPALGSKPEVHHGGC
jgi:two-component system, OmpR family, sensor histidine kinase BaeS